MKTKQKEGLVFLSPAGKVVKNRVEQIWGFEREVNEIHCPKHRGERGWWLQGQAPVAQSQSYTCVT